MTEAEHHALRLLVQADADNELDAAEAARVAAHLAVCPECRAWRADLQSLARRLRAELPRHPAPLQLRRHFPGRPKAERLRAAFAAAAAALAACLAAFMLISWNTPSTDVPDAVSAHVRALQPNHLIDVLSSDRHTVKPWFAGRLDFAPPVRDFAAQGFPLVGGRLDALDGRAVAALVYRRDKHLIDLFIHPAQGDAAPVMRGRDGYTTLAWSAGGMRFIAVSDLEPAELDRFAALWRGAG